MLFCLFPSAFPALAGTVAVNVLAQGTGAINVDACRVVGPEGDGNWRGRTKRERGEDFNGFGGGWNDDYEKSPVHAGDGQLGRWPANLLLTHAPECGDVCAPGCPVAGEMPGWVENAVGAVAGVASVQVKIVFDPPWDQARMSDEARVALDMW